MNGSMKSVMATMVAALVVLGAACGGETGMSGGGSAGGGSAGGGSAGGGSAGGGSAGGGSAGGGSAGGGSAGGGSAGGGSAGGGSAGGGSAGGGSAVDGGCATRTFHPVLGRLVLGTGVSTDGVAALPTGVLHVAALEQTDGGPGDLWALMGSGQVLRLGGFPNVALADAGIALRSPADEDAGIFPSAWFLGRGASTLVAGYTKAGAGYPGSVVQIDVSDAGRTFTSAPGNYAAASATGGVLVNGLGLGGVSNPDGGGVYALGTSASVAFTFAPAWKASSGVLAVSKRSGAVAVGYFDGVSFENVVRAVRREYVTAAFAGTTTSLEVAPVLYQGGDLFDVVSVGERFVLHRGSFHPTTFASITAELTSAPATELGDGGFQFGARTALVTGDGCTNVLFLAPYGEALLAGIEDMNGRRLVRLRLP